MTQKESLIAQATEKGLTLTGKETVPQLKALLAPSGQTVGGEAPTPAPKPAKESRSEVKEAAEAAKIVNSMKAMLDAQPKVGVFIPLEQGEPKGTQLPVEINGYRMNVPKGVPNVQVPQAVADIIWQALGVYDEASSALRSQNNPDRPLRLDLQDENDRSRVGA